MIPVSVETGDREAPQTNNAYEKELRRLQAELCHMQECIKTTGQRIIVVFEDREPAGKGGPSKRSPNASAHASSEWRASGSLDREKTQMYLALFAHFPAGGRIVIFDRSWISEAY